MKNRDDQGSISSTVVLRRTNPNFVRNMRAGIIRHSRAALIWPASRTTVGVRRVGIATSRLGRLFASFNEDSVSCTSNNISPRAAQIQVRKRLCRIHPQDAARIGLGFWPVPNSVRVAGACRVVPPPLRCLSTLRVAGNQFADLRGVVSRVPLSV